MAYSDKYGRFFARHTPDGYAILHVEDGSAATRLDANVYPIGSMRSARYEHAEGIKLTQQDTLRLGIEIDPVSC